MKKEDIVLAAQKRAAVISILTKAEEPVPAYRMYQYPELKKFNFTWTSMQAFLFAMKNNQLIDSRKIVDNKARVGYVLLTAKNGKAESVEKKVAKKQVVKQQKVKAVMLAPNLKIDVIKSTGRVRLELNGLFIEIGVID